MARRYTKAGAPPLLVIIDVKTGNVVWSIKNGDPAKGETGTSAPVVIKDKVFVGARMKS